MTTIECEEYGMRRLCFLVPDVDSAHGVVGDLRAAGIADANIFVVAREGTPLGDLPDAGEIAKSDFYPQLERGLAMGGTIGIIGGIVALRVLGTVIGGGAVLLFGLVGAGVSGMLSAIAGASFPNSRLVRFERDIEAGNVLIMIDAMHEQIPRIERIVRTRHPEAEFEGFEPPAPIIPR